MSNVSKTATILAPTAYVALSVLGCYAPAEAREQHGPPLGAVSTYAAPGTTSTVSGIYSSSLYAFNYGGLPNTMADEAIRRDPRAPSWWGQPGTIYSGYFPGSYTRG